MRPSCAQHVPTQIPTAQYCPLPTPALQGLTFRSRERHIRALVTVAAWGDKHGLVRAAGEELEEEYGGCPQGLLSVLSQGSGHPPLILMGSLSVVPFLSTCEEKTPVRDRSMGSSEPVTLDPREVSRTVITDPGQGQRM